MAENISAHSILSPQVYLAPDLSLPPPTAGGRWNYTYVTSDPKTGEWYAGKHTTKNLKRFYIGSGQWVKTHAARARLICQITAFYPTEIDAYEAEKQLVPLHIDDPLCRNQMPGGLGFTATIAAAQRKGWKWAAAYAASMKNPVVLQRMSDAAIARCTPDAVARLLNNLHSPAAREKCNEAVRRSEKHKRSAGSNLRKRRQTEAGRQDSVKGGKAGRAARDANTEAAGGIVYGRSRFKEWRRQHIAKQKQAKIEAGTYRPRGSLKGTATEETLRKMSASAKARWAASRKTNS